MITSLQRRMGLLFLAFSLLVSISVAATSWTIDTQKQDALVINLAGRQRMLIQQMTKDALQIEQDQGEEHPRSVALQEAARTFDQTLRALTNGGQAPYLPDRPVDVSATQSPDILTGLQQVHHTWEIFRGYLDTLMAADPDSQNFTTAVQAVERLSPDLVQEADDVVRLYEAASAQKVVRLRWIQIAFFVSVLGLLAVGFLVTRKSVVEPLRRLGSSAERIGRGDLETSVEVTGPREIKILARNFDTMRAQLKASQEEMESRVAQRTRELTAAFEFSQEIVAEMDLDHLLSSVADRARALTQAQAAALCLLESNGKYLELAAYSGGQTAFSAGLRQFPERGLAAQVIDAGQTVATKAACFNCDFLNAHAPGRCIAAPLHAGEHTLGALCVVRPEQEKFDPDETRALTLLANSAAIAIANAHLVEAGQRQAKQAATLAERERLAADLHDNLAQTLSFLRLKTERVEEILAGEQTTSAISELEDMKTAIKIGYGQVRVALTGLREPPSATDDLAQKLATCVADFRESSSLPADLTIADPVALALPGMVQGQILHIIREALTNVRRHAQAQQVWVRAERVNGETYFTVKDNGCGFDPAKIEGNNHFGLTIMRARAERSGGGLIIDSTPGAGTKIIAHFPLPDKLVTGAITHEEIAQ